MTKHRELVLSKKPLAYYPLDEDLLNSVNAGMSTATSTTVYNGSNDTTAGVFFRGNPLVYGLKNACVLRFSSDYIQVPAYGFFSKYGDDRALAMEFYTMSEVGFSGVGTRENHTSIVRFETEIGAFEISSVGGMYYARLFYGSGDDARSVSTSVYSGVVNRVTQIVVNWTPSTVSIAVDGEVSPPIDITDAVWTTSTQGFFKFSGTGTSGTTTTYRRYVALNSISIFPRNLTKVEIDELREAAFQDANQADPVALYKGDFIECTGLNIKRNGQWTVNEDFELQGAGRMFGVEPRGGEISWPGYQAPQVAQQDTQTQEKIIVDPKTVITTNSSRAAILLGAKYVTYDHVNEIPSVDTIGVAFNALGTGLYTSKRWLASWTSGDTFIGVYTQSQNLYYEYSDLYTGESTSAVLVTGIDTWVNTTEIYIALSKRSNATELICANSPASGTSYATLYAQGSTGKVTLAAIPKFFNDSKLTIGLDPRDLDNSSVAANSYFTGIYFGYVDSSSETNWKPVRASISSVNPETGFMFGGAPNLKYSVPAELLAPWDGSTTPMNSVVGYFDSDCLTYYTHYPTYATGYMTGSIQTALGNLYGVPGMMSFKIDPTGDVSNKFFDCTLNPTYRAPYLHPTLKKFEFVNYKVNASGYVEIVDGRSKYALEVSPTMTVPLDAPPVHKRGLNDGVRSNGRSTSIGVQPRIVIPASDTLYGISFMVWVDGDPTVQNVTTGGFTTTDFIKFTGTGGFTLSLAASATTRFFGVDLTGANGVCRVYINGKWIDYATSTPFLPTTAGAFTLNSWNHVFLPLTTPITGGCTITFDKSIATNGALYSDFERGTCYNDIGIFTGTDFPTSNANKDLMANRLAAPYEGTAVISNTTQDCIVFVSESTQTLRLGDGNTTEVGRQWKPLV